MAMDLSPMNLQIMVPKATEVSQVQHNLNQQAVVQQDFEMIRDQADAKLKMEQVRSRDEMEDGKIKDDPDRRGKNGGYSGGRRQGGQASQGEAEEPSARMAVGTFRGHNIDIKL